MEKIAKILRADKQEIVRLEEKMRAATGKRGVLEKIEAENQEKIKEKLLILGVPANAPAREIYDALISKIEADDNLIFEALGRPVCSKIEDCDRVLAIAQKTADHKKYFFLRKEKAADFLKSEPPRKILDYLDYKTVDEMLAKEDLFEVYSALRFVEGNDWLNGVFFKQYEKLKPSDFEEREITVKALSAKWGKVAENFVAKKRHNISHLKELGVVFVLPVALGISGEILRMVSLILHYLREVPFYADLFKRAAGRPETFAANLISLLRGDVLEKRLPESGKAQWLVVQRYLAKDDENDWRLFYPHINPEALHWLRAEEDLVKIGTTADGFGSEMSFWHDLDWVGDYFRDETGFDVLVSFDLVDAVMSLVKEKEMAKYLYHHQEALWNKIFIEYFSREELDRYCREYLLDGYFRI